MNVARIEGIPILTYHSIDPSGSVVSTAPEVFRRQMKSLSEMDYNVVALNNLVEVLANKKTYAPKTVALTFDDGFQNFYTTAFPILKEYGFQATVFLVTDYCGKYNDWGDALPKLPRSKLLAWQEIKELNNCGIEFGTHTRTHPNLTKIALAQVKDEIIDSKRIIEDSLGCEVTTFAYPYGRFNESVKQIAAKNFQAACSTKMGKVRRDSDLFSLERIDTYYLSKQVVFNALPSNAFDRYLQVRQILRDFKTLMLRN